MPRRRRCEAEAEEKTSETVIQKIFDEWPCREANAGSTSILNRNANFLRSDFRTFAYSLENIFSALRKIINPIQALVILLLRLWKKRCFRRHRYSYDSGIIFSFRRLTILGCRNTSWPKINNRLISDVAYQHDCVNRFAVRECLFLKTQRELQSIACYSPISLRVLIGRTAFF